MATHPNSISPLGVAVDRKGKIRLVAVEMYLNALSGASLSSVKSCDTLKNMLVLVTGQLTDAKSGYHHISVHPKFWKHLCFFSGRM